MNNGTSNYRFRFGTYGSNNPLYSTATIPAIITTTTSAYGITIPAPTITSSHITTSGGSISNLISSDSSSYAFTRDVTSSRDISSIKISSQGFKTETITNTQTLTISCKVTITHPTRLNFSSTSTMLMTFKDEEGRITPYSTSQNISRSRGSDVYTSESAVQLTLEFKSDFLTSNTLDSLQFILSDNIKGANLTYKIEGLKCTLIKETSPAQEVNRYHTHNGKRIYLCPWELKHVNAVTFSTSGTTATMGIPNAPASRTQIFDTGGPIRTIKISGRRYDYEENISNWDFVNTQFNISTDAEYGGPTEYCYIGLSWMLSTMQVLLKGYLFYIGNEDPTDMRFLHSDVYSTEYAMKYDALPEEAKPKDEEAVIEVEGQYYICTTSPSDEHVWVPYAPSTDTGFNVALTAVNVTFSETEPGLMSYTLTLVERFKNGTKLYQPYNPEYEDV